MLKKYNIFIGLFKIAKVLLMLASLIYLFVWIAMIFMHDVYLMIDNYFNYLPSKFDMVFKPSTKIENAAPMGYMYASCVSAFLSLIFINLEKKLNKNKDLVVEQERRKEIRQQQKLKKEKELRQLEKELGLDLNTYGLESEAKTEEKPQTKKTKLQAKKEVKKESKQNKATKQETKKEIITPQKNDENYEIKTIYGLFEIKINSKDKNDDFNLLIEEYSKLLSKKIKEKYLTIRFALSEKIFIVFDDYTKLVELIEDIIRIYKLLEDVNKQNKIESYLLLSFWCDKNPNVAKKAHIILSNINKLNNKNKIVISKTIKLALEKDYKNLIKIKSLNALKIKDSNNKETKLELFEMKTNNTIL